MDIDFVALFGVPFWVAVYVRQVHFQLRVRCSWWLAFLSLYFPGLFSLTPGVLNEYWSLSSTFHSALPLIFLVLLLFHKTNAV